MTDRIDAMPERSRTRFNLRRAATLLGEAVKAVGALFLLFFMVLAVAKPTVASAMLVAFHVEDIEFFGFKVKIAQATAAASEDSIKAARAVQEASEQIQAGKIDGAVQLLNQASRYLTEQSQHFNGAAQAFNEAPGSGAVDGSKLVAIPPSNGWIHVGYFNDSGQPARLADSISQGGVTLGGQTGSPGIQVSALVLAKPAYVITDGDNCALPDVSKVDLSKIEPPIAILKPGLEPLKVIKTAACPAPGRGFDVWAKVDAPQARILANRYAAR